MPNQTPSVSVITRTKDRPEFIKRSIQSVQNQNYENFIQVIINDGGDPKPIEEAVEKYSNLIKGRVKLIHNAESLGMEAASNKAIKSVESDYIAIHDDDDTWHPDFLKLSVAKMEECGAMGVVVRADKVIERLSNNGEIIEKIKSQTFMPDLKVVNLYRQCIDNQMTPITFIYRREALEIVGYYDEDLPVLGDWEFGIRFLKEYDVEYLDPGYALAFYHHRPYQKEAVGNSNYGPGHDKHRYWSNKLMNKYLREELAQGKLGIGYIMNQLKYDQSQISRYARSVLPKFLHQLIKKRLE